MSIVFQTRPAPIYMLGDSQCLIFNNLLFEAYHGQEKFSLITQAKYCPGLAANNFIDNRERLHETILRALLSECLIDTQNRALYQFQGPLSSIITLLAGRVPQSPILVLFCGGSDLVNVFLRHVGENNDFYLPDQETLLAAFEPVQGVQVFPYQTARDYVFRLFEPLARGIRKLKSMGFHHLFLHNIAPQTLDDEDYKRVRLYPCPAYVRYKSLLLFNQMLKELAANEGIGFIDIWNEVTLQNQLDPRFYLDSIHLNKEAAFLTMDKLWANLTDIVSYHYVTENKDIRALYEAVGELSIRLSNTALNFKYAQVISLYEDNQKLLARARDNQVELQHKIPFIISGLYYVARSYYALRDFSGLIQMIKANQSFFAEYKGMVVPGQPRGDVQSPVKKTHHLYLLESNTIGNIPNDCELPVVLVSEEPERIDLKAWQSAYPDQNFQVCSVSPRDIQAIKPILLATQVCYVPQSCPGIYGDLIIFALIEGIEVHAL